MLPTEERADMPVHPSVHAYMASEEFYPDGSVIVEEGTVGDWSMSS